MPVRNGEWLSSKVHFAWIPWWVVGGKHNGIEEEFRDTYYAKLQAYLRDVYTLQTELGSDD